MTPSSFRDVAGTVSLEEGALVLHRSWGRRLRSQVVRWRHGGKFDRLLAVISVLYTVSLPVLAVSYLALALVLDPWWASGPSRNLFWGVVGLAFLAMLLDEALRPRQIPLSRLEGGVETSGARTLRLPADAFGRLRALVRLGIRPKINFVTSTERDRFASLLERQGIEVNRR